MTDLRLASPILAVLLAVWGPIQTRTPFAEAVPVAEAVRAPQMPQLICGIVAGASTDIGDFGAILRLSDPAGTGDLLIAIPARDHNHFGRLLEMHLINRLVCLDSVIRPMPGGPVIELLDPSRIRFVSAGPAPAPELFDGVSAEPGVTAAVPSEPRNPLYSPRARAALVQGEAELLVRIDEFGDVTTAHVTRSVDPLLGLDTEAIAAVMLWKFRPADVAGTPVPSVATVVMEFDLGVSQATRSRLVTQESGQRAVAVLESTLAADDPFAAGTTTRREVLPSAVWTGVPRYSFEGLKAGIEGSVGLDLVVAADGSVTRARVAESLASGQYGLDDAALAAVSAWRFAPAVVDGQPAAAVVRARVRFGMRLPGDPGN